MEIPGEKAKLEDVINYKPETYFSDAEVEWIRGMFAGERGRMGLKIMRKVLIPTISDPELPIEEINGDPWLNKTDFSAMPSEHVKAVVQGRQEAMKYCVGALIKLKVIANSKADRVSDKGKDSAK